MRWSRAWRSSFDKAADVYHRVRPAYPVELIEAAVRYAGLAEGSRVLEVGCGTGLATLPFAKRGFDITCLELGSALAKVARENLQAYPRVTVVNAALEDWDAAQESFDLFLSAQAFHWVEPEYGVNRAATLLEPGGSVALLWHLDRSRESAFNQATNPLYDRYFGNSSDNRTLDDWVTLYRETLTRHPRFSEVTVQTKAWEESYSKTAFLELLSTFSDHRRLEPAAREAFFDEVAGVIEAHGGSVTRLYETVLLLAKRVETV